MSTLLTVRHRTVYRYVNPVRLGEHRLMCRPRDSHDLRMIETGLAISPMAQVRWLHDVFGNSIAIARFEEPATELVVETSFVAQHFPIRAHDIVIEPYAEFYPFRYAADEVPDLGRTDERHYADPDHRVDAWARRFAAGGRPPRTIDLLLDITRAIRNEFGYGRREEMGTQSPTETLDLGGGSCRDFALFMMEAVRSLGFAARFVSGYLYDEALVGATGGLVGSGETHAWVQVYLPGAGWVEFDPTNALAGGRNLIRVAVARDARQAIPLSGSYTGNPGDFIDMQVEVSVTAD
jgi:transglutaminase-like putative cysteine protease